MIGTLAIRSNVQTFNLKLIPFNVVFATCACYANAKCVMLNILCCITLFYNSLRLNSVFTSWKANRLISVNFSFYCILLNFLSTNFSFSKIRLHACSLFGEKCYLYKWPAMDEQDGSCQYVRRSNGYREMEDLTERRHLAPALFLQRTHLLVL